MPTKEALKNFIGDMIDAYCDKFGVNGCINMLLGSFPGHINREISLGRINEMPDKKIRIGVN